jgi:hypothetical protein
MVFKGRLAPARTWVIGRAFLPNSGQWCIKGAVFGRKAHLMAQVRVRDSLALIVGLGFSYLFDSLCICSLCQANITCYKNLRMSGAFWVH